MLLLLTHTTDLKYSGLISESVMELRMCPRQEQDQHRLSFTLAVGPPTPAFTYFDWLGNSVHWFTVNAFHKQIKIVATSVVETDRPRPVPERFSRYLADSANGFRLLNLRLPSVRGTYRRIAGASRACESDFPSGGAQPGGACAGDDAPDRRSL